MIEFVQIAIGTALAAAGWLIPRRVAGASSLGSASLLDAAPLVLPAVVLFVGSGRPVFTGAVVFALGAGFAIADRTMRAALREPLVFTALSEVPQLFTHPHLYLPFAGTGLVLGIVVAAIAVALTLLIAEPAATAPHPTVAILGAGIAVALLLLAGREPRLASAATAMRRLGPTGEPFADAARLGPFAMLLAHGIVARAERPARRARLTAPGGIGGAAAGRPIVLVQCESFFDARRALPTLPNDFLAGYDAACGEGISGRLAVPAWGANTTRAEFAVLTGIAEEPLGYDRFNPYHALARGRVASQVWRLRAAGYRTICLHPFDRRFYRRDLVMPALGFETFLGRETLGGSRTPPYMSDPELARHVLRVLEATGPSSFIFVITMGNHGPWLKDVDARNNPRIKSGDGHDVEIIKARFRQGADLRRYLEGLRRSDEMLAMLIDELERRHPDALLGFYGDHLPSLPRALAHLGFDDWRSDYTIYSAAAEAGGRRDLAAHELGSAIVDLALVPRIRARRDAVVVAPYRA